MKHRNRETATARVRLLFVRVVVALPGIFAATHALSDPRLDIGLLMGVARSIVRIEADRPGYGIQIGTGVVLADGEIVTACHVVRDARVVYVIYGGRRRAASRLRIMPQRDVCAFSVVGLKAPVAKMRPAERLQIGKPVTALGFSGGAEMKWKTGTILRKHRFAGSIVSQTTTPFTSGASGGPLLDAGGNVVGLLNFRTPGPGPNFYAVPVEWAIDAIELDADQSRVNTHFTTLPFWDRQRDDLPFFMQASSLEGEQRWNELRRLCEVWEVEEPTSGEPAFIESRIDEHFGRFEAVHERLVIAVDRDAQHVLAWASLVRVRLYLKDISDAGTAYSPLRVLNMHVPNQLVVEGLIAGQ